jgi:DNA transformation protein and related proteins
VRVRGVGAADAGERVGRRLLNRVVSPPADHTHIIELFAAFGPVSVRRMFGGAGIFCDGLMIGLVADGMVYLKADEPGQAAFTAEGMGPFTYGKAGKRVIMSYWRMPERLYDDPDELARWAADALAAARRGTGAPRGHRKGGRVGRAKK